MVASRTQQLSQSIEELQALLGQLADGVDRPRPGADDLEESLEELRVQLGTMLTRNASEISRLASRVVELRDRSAGALSRAEWTITGLQADLGSTTAELEELISQAARARAQQQQTQERARDYIEVIQREANHLRQSGGDLAAQPDAIIRAVSNLLQISIRLAGTVFPPDQLRALASDTDRLVADSLRHQWTRWLQSLGDYLEEVLPLAQTLELLPQQGLLRESYGQQVETVAEQIQAFGSSAPMVPRAASGADSFDGAEIVEARDVLGQAWDGPAQLATPSFSVVMEFEIPGEEGESSRTIEVMLADRVMVPGESRRVSTPEGDPLRVRLERGANRVSFWRRTRGYPKGELLASGEDIEVPKGDYSIGVTAKEDELEVKALEYESQEFRELWRVPFPLPQ